MYISILLPRGVSLSPGAMRMLLRRAQRRCGCSAWGGAVAEEFRGRNGTLLLVRPALSAEIADYALPFIHKQFTD